MTEKDEGELKKRIYGLSLSLEPWVSDEDEGSAILCPHQYSVNLKKILELLDECAEDFPDIWHGMQVEELRKQMGKIADWKWKWFGVTRTEGEK